MTDKNEHDSSQPRPAPQIPVRWGERAETTLNDLIKTTLNDLIESGRDFTGVPEAAGILACDRRTVRREIDRGNIPAVRVGVEWRIPVRWLATQAGVAA